MSSGLAFIPTSSTPKTPTVTPYKPLTKFIQDSEFTFGNPSEVEGMSQDQELENIAPKRNIKFTFSPPGKSHKKNECLKDNSSLSSNAKKASSGISTETIGSGGKIAEEQASGITIMNIIDHQILMF
jgi:hypothetical protein